MMHELGGCPHCGSPAGTPTNWGNPFALIPRCSNPACLAEARSIEAWNRRAPAPEAARLLAAAKAMLDEVALVWGGPPHGCECPMCAARSGLRAAVAACEAK